MPTYRSGRHELGQNFLTDRKAVDTIVDLVSRTDGPIIEIGSGGGALTLPLQALRRPITAIEIDPRHVQKLQHRVDPSTTVVHGDFLRYRLPRTPHTIVGNLPFHHTTAMLRRILHAEHWTASVLLVQWEVARRRAAVGGATMMTAQWWPWYDFGLAGRVSASAFTPRPGVDAGLMTIARRTVPLVDPALRPRYSTFVHTVFTSKGHGLHQILPRVAGDPEKAAVKKWLAGQRFRGTPLPRDLSPGQWSELFAIIDRRSPATDRKRAEYRR
ncbi:23S rRNA (adenine(2058)-N(6))-methyltransferase Erm(46) (plasmid) [Prescottella equi]|uniref:23S rRNA (Adenine(2058)-N(6))-methyltransferase Erm(46) n=1 Tax=Rhodococcus hoagii TaxID=43767 RepID=A0A0R5YJB2_RHOHA|nr:23S rRNA (adenine(2058)-N(6))-methyltransferase Erm(46) [Prescottella equi]AJF36617.1 ErmREQ [Prescottella equi]AVR64921.1 Ern(46) rRNA methyltransferase [Prescottella equi]AVR64930.1 Erm(46) rRNA methyltransferase [Prescottella equi]AVR64969.1 Erm(46)rRNA methyltransferase [Prescottella equi]MBM4479836.1 23S rRNA (adenine(2058)-N(6))-methyltransferase Erm(46) [Prescottella equi]